VHTLVGPLALQLIYDPKTSFSFIERGSIALTIGEVLLTGLLLCVVVALPSNLVKIGAGLTIGGMLGNMCDILTHSPHGVVDFITINEWLSFNLADVSVLVGISLLLAGITKQVISQKRLTSRSSATATVTSRPHVQGL
jgi:lipoprotein signal peptidase